MARVNKVNRSRKEKVCGRCKEIIPVGSPYLYVDFYSGRTAIRCEKCGFRRSETTENPYYQELYRIQEEYDTELDNAGETEISDVVENLVSELESLRDEVQERFDNIPEQLQDGEAGSLLQERIDSIDSAISDIENEELEDFDDWRENNGYGEEDFESWCEEQGFIDEDTDIEDYREDFNNEASESYNNDYLEEFKSNIRDYLNDIE